MLKTKPIRQGRFTAIPKALREQAKKPCCEWCGRAYEKIIFIPGRAKPICIRLRETIDHIIPRRWLQARGLNPHVEENLISICTSDHPRKRRCEDALFLGLGLDYITALSVMSFPMDKVRIASEHYNLGLEKLIL